MNLAAEQHGLEAHEVRPEAEKNSTKERWPYAQSLPLQKLKVNE